MKVLLKFKSMVAYSRCYALYDVSNLSSTQDVSASFAVAESCPFDVDTIAFRELDELMR